MLSGERNATDGWTPDEQLHFCVSDSKLLAFKGLHGNYWGFTSWTLMGILLKIGHDVVVGVDLGARGECGQLSSFPGGQVLLSGRSGELSSQRLPGYQPISLL